MLGLMLVGCMSNDDVQRLDDAEARLGLQGARDPTLSVQDRLAPDLDLGHVKLAAPDGEALGEVRLRVDGDALHASGRIRGLEPDAAYHLRVHPAPICDWATDEGRSLELGSATADDRGVLIVDQILEGVVVGPEELVDRTLRITRRGTVACGRVEPLLDVEEDAPGMKEVPM